MVLNEIKELFTELLNTKNNSIVNIKLSDYLRSLKSESIGLDKLEEEIKNNNSIIIEKREGGTSYENDKTYLWNSYNDNIKTLFNDYEFKGKEFNEVIHSDYDKIINIYCDGNSLSRYYYCFNKNDLDKFNIYLINLDNEYIVKFINKENEILNEILNKLNK